MLSTPADNYTIIQEHSVQETKYVLSHDKVHVNKTKVMITLKGFFKTCCLKNGQESLLRVGLFSQPSPCAAHKAIACICPSWDDPYCNIHSSLYNIFSQITLLIYPVFCTNNCIYHFMARNSAPV